MARMNLYYDKPMKPPGGRTTQLLATHPFQRGVGLPGSSWGLRHNDHRTRHPQEFQHSDQYEDSGWNYPASTDDSGPASLSSGFYHSSPYTPSALGHPVTRKYLGDMGRPMGDFPMLVWGLPQGPNFVMHSDMSKPRLRATNRSTTPNICILALAMMIAGIPTVPVPGVREEDMIATAQAFMEGRLNMETGLEYRWRAEHPTSHGQLTIVEGIPGSRDGPRTRNRSSPSQYILSGEF
ncbi:hypothetical protein NDU88_001814 [Pleurodeles waltl]|uniref:Uncharacterized protein n=1 Tax=Pleurodeles waltl TaxID=8319 RepID=A0AAV7PC99_PLEWA|nr:hypothetical protein NDU88_001814 [Pleurodeles waltl]